MLAYLFKRVLLFVPVLLVVSVLAFFLSRIAPGDQVVSYLQEDPLATVSSATDLLEGEKRYRTAAALLNLDKPLFYFSISPAAFPDTLYKVVFKNRRETLKKLIAQYGNWPQVQAYHGAIRQLDLHLLALPDSLAAKATDFKLNLRELYILYHDEQIISHLEKMEHALQKAPALADDFFYLKNKYHEVKEQATPLLLKIPVVHWYGVHNQYHRWVAGFVRGDFGVSVFRKRTAADIIAPALFWTILLNVSAILLAFAVAVPLGIWSAVKKGERFDRIVSMALFMLYSLPVFWIGTLLLIFFTNNEYGMDIFKGAWLGHLPAELSFWQKIKTIYPYLLLPIICVAYPAIAFIARQARGSMAGVLHLDYIKTARAKGLPENSVIWKHGFRNALFPLITMFAGILPASIAGSVTIEFIYNIPGIGLTMFQSIMEQDWPVVFAIMMLGAVLTVAGILLSDILYALADPRVRYR